MQLAPYTNNLSQQRQFYQLTPQVSPIVDSPVGSLFTNSNNIDCNIALIDQIIDTPELLSELKTLSSKLRHYEVLQFYTDSSLQ